MNYTPLLKAKLAVPEIPGKVLFSARIKSLNLTEYRTVLITAPAGFGKTTAVLLSLDKDRANMRWYRLEKEDSFLPVFYTHLIETLLGQETEGITESARSLASIGSISEKYPLLNALICQDAWTWYSDRTKPLYLIFDDFQHVTDNSAILETIRYLTANLPPQLRIIVISKVDTGIPTDKLALNKEVLLINEEALRFSKEEIAELTLDTYNVKIDSAHIHTMHEYSEGWIAGITLLLHATEANIYKHGKPLTHDDRQTIFRYLLNEGFGGAEKAMLKTLARISILSDFTCNDLKAIFNMENAAETIAWLEKNNLYIQKTNTKTTSYRFHSLFRSALHSALNELYTPAEIDRMNLSAAEHYKNLGDFKAAIRFLNTAGRIDEAIGLASVEGVRFMDIGDTDQVTSIVQAFPEESRQNNPILLFLLGASLMSTELDKSYSYLNKALMLAIEAGNLDLQMKAAGLMISICVQKNDHQKIADIIGLLPKFKMLAFSKYARITLLMSGFMKIAWSDRLGLGKALYKLIDRLGFQEPLWDYTYKLTKGLLFYRAGNLPAAEVILHQVLNHPVALVNDRWRTIGLTMCQNITSLMRDMETSQKLIGELASIGEKYNSDYAHAYAFRLSAYNKYQARDISGAVSEMEKAENAFTRSNNPIMVCVTRITKYLWAAECEAAEPLATKAFEELNHLEALKPSLGFVELCQAKAGALFKEAGCYTEAEGLLTQAYKVSKRKKAIQSLGGAALHLADLYYRKKEFPLEEKYLRIWGKTVANNGYVYFREMNYPTLVRICARCIEMNINPDYMLRILGNYFNHEHIARIAVAPAKVVGDPVSFILSCSPSSQKSKLIQVKLFGRFSLVVNDVEIGEKEWKTRKICGILKYLLVNREKTISREVLAATFWPESDAKAAYTSLRVALFELRKILTRLGMAFDSEDALIAEGKNGFYLCSGNTIESDADRFAWLYEKYKSENLTPEGRKTLLLQMVELYAGDFLEADSYDEWVALSREHYKSIFIEVSHKLATLYIDSGELEQAETLLSEHMNVDPFDEKACSMLIYLYNSSGRKHQASSLHRQFNKRFKAEMGVKPDLSYPQ